jgi:ubiquinone/menaquinone biosynthesis C-methylase UbiE
MRFRFPSFDFSQLGQSSFKRSTESSDPQNHVRVSFTQRNVTQFYDSLVFPSRGNDSAYSRLASEVVKNGWRVGDFGCGQSLFYSIFRDLSPEPVFLDISLNALRTIDYGARLQADLCQLPLRGGVFHAIFCIGVLHHLPDMCFALEELARVTASGGILIVGVYSPNSSGAHLKRAYDRIHNELLRQIVFNSAVLLLWAKLSRRFNLSWENTRKRVSDLLDTPIVRYLGTESYENMAAQAGLKVFARGMISNMNILYFRKGSSSADD